MPTHSVDLLGLVIKHPSNCVTNLLLFGESWILFRMVHPGGFPSLSLSSGGKEMGHQRWAGFFLFLGLAAFLGTFKHGIPHYLAPFAMGLIVVGSGGACGIAILLAEAETIQVQVRRKSFQRLLRVAAVMRFALSLGALILFRSFLIVVVNAAIGLGFLVVGSIRASREGEDAAAWRAWGLGVSVLAGGAYLLGPSSFPWFDPIDQGHVILMLSLLFIFRGVGVPDSEVFRRDGAPEETHLPSGLEGAPWAS